jgi:hypothetical protein
MRSPLLAFALNFLPALCEMTAGRAGHGLIGYGITMYSPPCAFSCRASISSATLNCSTMAEDMPGMDMGGSASTSPECYATDDFFLETLAYCISTHCQDIDVWRLERYWEMNVAGTAPDQPAPKESYQDALEKVTSVPNVTYSGSGSLNQTSVVAAAEYNQNWNALTRFEEIEDTHERYG